MTPSSRIEDFPFSGDCDGAVKLEADELCSCVDAILTIEPTNDTLLEHQACLGFHADRQGPCPAMPVVDSAAILFRLEHFSGAGVGNGVRAESAKALDRTPTTIRPACNQGPVGSWAKNVRGPSCTIREMTRSWLLDSSPP